MDKRQSILLGLLAALLVGIFLLSVAVGSGGGSADPRRSGGIESLDGLLGGLPGFGRGLDPETVDVECFDGDSFRVDDSPCAFTVPEGVDRLILRPLQPNCQITVDRQDGIGEQRLGVSDADDSGNLRIALAGDGVDVSINSTTDSSCVVELA